MRVNECENAASQTTKQMIYSEPYVVAHLLVLFPRLAQQLAHESHELGVEVLAVRLGDGPVALGVVAPEQQVGVGRDGALLGRC